ncbi:hypothetical protein DFH06DRAFT_1145429 [Mycena polygramma]|nr:hypothetical protein DFH06DRAFT_1145429 [Mycena polygramma]
MGRGSDGGKCGMKGRREIPIWNVENRESEGMDGSDRKSEGNGGAYGWHDKIYEQRLSIHPERKRDKTKEQSRAVSDFQKSRHESLATATKGRERDVKNSRAIAIDEGRDARRGPQPALGGARTDLEAGGQGRRGEHAEYARDRYENGSAIDAEGEPDKEDQNISKNTAMELSSRPSGSGVHRHVVARTVLEQRVVSSSKIPALWRTYAMGTQGLVWLKLFWQVAVAHWRKKVVSKETARPQRAKEETDQCNYDKNRIAPVSGKDTEARRFLGYFHRVEKKSQRRANAEGDLNVPRGMYDRGASSSLSSWWERKREEKTARSRVMGSTTATVIPTARQSPTSLNRTCHSLEASAWAQFLIASFCFPPLWALTVSRLPQSPTSHALLKSQNLSIPAAILTTNGAKMTSVRVEAKQAFRDTFLISLSFTSLGSSSPGKVPKADD